MTYLDGWLSPCHQQPLVAAPFLVHLLSAAERVRRELAPLLGRNQQPSSLSLPFTEASVKVCRLSFLRLSPAPCSYSDKLISFYPGPSLPGSKGTRLSTEEAQCFPSLQSQFPLSWSLASIDFSLEACLSAQTPLPSEATR